MALFYDMRTGNQAGLAARAAAGTLTVVHLNLSTQQLGGLTSKAPDVFFADFFDRSTTFAGPIWCVICGALAPPTQSRDWQIQCQFGNAADIACLTTGPSIEWLDAFTSITLLHEGTHGLYFDMDVKALKQGVVATHHEPHSILV